MGEARVKEFRFPVAVEWAGGKRVVARVEGKEPLEVATPPEFRGTDPGLWSPEDLFVGAAAACLAVTVVSLADRAGLALHRMAVAGEGVVGGRDDGRFGFTRVELALELDVDAGEEERARELAARAEETCLVAVSLDLPVETAVAVLGVVPVA